MKETARQPASQTESAGVFAEESVCKRGREREREKKKKIERKKTQDSAGERRPEKDGITGKVNSK